MPSMSATYMRDYRAQVAARAVDGGLLPFQRQFVGQVTRQDRPPEIAALSVPRGNGKSWLCGGLVARSLTPGDPLFEPGVENILVSASTNQARIVLEFARAALGASDDYRWGMNGAMHTETRTRVRVISSDSRRAMGLGANVRIVIADEPGAWSPVAGRRLWDAICTALGKRKTTVVAVGTLAPAALTGPASWWPSFIASGSGEGRHVALLQAGADKWEDFQEVLRVNPVASISRTCSSRAPFPLALDDPGSVLAVKGSLRRFAPWTAPGRSERRAVHDGKGGVGPWGARASRERMIKGIIIHCGEAGREPFCHTALRSSDNLPSRDENA